MRNPQKNTGNSSRAGSGSHAQSAEQSIGQSAADLGADSGSDSGAVRVFEPASLPLSLEIYLEKLIEGLGSYESSSRSAAKNFGLSGISLSRAEAHVLRWMAQSKSAKKAVEIGTLTGLSGLYLLDGLAAGGKLWTLEKNVEHASAAREILSKFALSIGKSVEVIIGDARQTLRTLASSGPFDLIFIDGNKAAYGDYLAWSELNLRSGGLLIADNVFLSGAVGFAGGAGAGAGTGAGTGSGAGVQDRENSFDRSSKFSPKQIRVMHDFNSRLMDGSVWRAALLPTSEGLFIAEKI